MGIKIPGYDIELPTSLAETPDALQNFLNAARQVIQNAALVNETQYEFEYDVFPNDIGTDQKGHYVEIRVYTGMQMATGAVADAAAMVGAKAGGRNAYNAALFIPGASPGESMPMIYDQQHAYTDIRLTSIFNDSMLSVSLAAGGRKQINPMVQVMYRSTNLRQFQFSFLLVPKNEKESKSIERMVTRLRGYAAPELQGPAVIAPAEFEFHFMRNPGRVENPHIPKIARCVVTKIQANWAPSGTFSAFKNGYPVACLLTIDATEVRLIDRNKIFLEGF